MAGYKGGNPYKGVAPALNTLLDQLNRRAPKRSKASDGALGNAAHAASVSFHNPNPAGIVQARDYTNDPDNGLDCKWLAKALTLSGDPRILEIISNRQYWTPKGGWVPYTGSNPHDKHLHLSVASDPKLYNSTEPWDLSAAGTSDPEEEFTVAQYDNLVALVKQQHQDMARLNYAILAEAQNASALLRGLTGDTADGGDRLADIWAALMSLAKTQGGAAPTAEAIAAAIPEDLAEQVAQKLADRLAA